MDYPTIKLFAWRNIRNYASCLSTKWQLKNTFANWEIGYCPPSSDTAMISSFSRCPHWVQKYKWANIFSNKGRGSATNHFQIYLPSSVVAMWANSPLPLAHDRVAERSPIKHHFNCRIASCIQRIEHQSSHKSLGRLLHHQPHDRQGCSQLGE